MRKVSESVENMLLDYLDGNLTKADKAKVEKNIQEIPAWQVRFDELRSVNTALAEAKTIMSRQASEIQIQINALQLDCADLNRRLSIKQLSLNQAYRELGNLQRSIREVDARI